MKLSKRLQVLANLIEKYKQGDVLADIGTDHAYLPCYLIENKIVNKVYACDVAKGPYKSSLSTIKQRQISDDVEALLGDGLDPILDKKVDMIAIAGMGSFLITEILEKNIAYLNKIEIMFLQPNANTDHLRKYLFEHKFNIIDESLVKDGDHIYEMMVVKKVNQVMDHNEYDIEFGPILKKQLSPLFIDKWQKQYKVYQNIMKDLSKEHPRYIELKHKMKMIEVILNESI